MLLADLARYLDAQLSGDGAADITACAALADAGPSHVSFLANAKYAKDFGATKAGAVIVPESVTTGPVPLLRCKDSYYAFSRAVVLLHGHRRHPHAGVHPAAHVDPSAVVGENTVVYPGAVVGPRARIGRDCVLYPNCVVYDDCVLGDRVILHANAVIGVDGFGYATHGGVHHKIPQVGRVVVGDDVEIGAATVIARGALADTMIGAGTKIDALVMIGHGVTIGPGCVLVAQAGIAGSTTIGKYVTIGGQAAIVGHVDVGDLATLAGRSAVMNDVEPKSTMIGMPAMPASHARRVYVQFTQLPELAARVKELERRLAARDAEPHG